MDAAGYRATASELAALVDAEVERFAALSEAAAARPRAPGAWSAKQVLGHLVDSAANNHQRFVRLQLQRHVRLEGYDADDWVRLGGYEALSWQSVVALWAAYNRFLAQLIARIDPAADTNTWTAPEGEPADLGGVVADYVRHLRHHLGQIVTT